MCLIEQEDKERLQDLVSRSPGFGEFLLEPLDVGSETRRLKSAVGDSPERFWLTDTKGAKRYIVAISPPDFPEAVASWIVPARQVFNLVSSRMAAHICLPVLEGRCDGRTYAVWSFYQGWAPNRTVASLELLLNSGRIQAWLSDFAQETCKVVSEESEVRHLFLDPITLLTQEVALSDAVRREAKAILARLEAGDQPLLTVAQHGDFWYGNILHDGSPLAPSSDLKVIDWGAGSTRGYPFYDLIKLLSSSSVLRKPFGRRWVKRYAASIGVDLSDSTFYLLCGLGALGMNRAQFPFERYVDLVERQYSTLRDLC